MPLGEIAGDALGGMARIAGRLLFELFVECMIWGAGYLLVRTLRIKAGPDDTICVVAGLLFWTGIGIGSYVVYRAVSARQDCQTVFTGHTRATAGICRIRPAKQPDRQQHPPHDLTRAADRHALIDHIARAVP